MNYNKSMSCVNLQEQFYSYLDFNPHQSSYWNTPAFMKSCNDALYEVETLKTKIKQFDAVLSKNRLRHNPEQESQMLHNLKQNIKACEGHLKRLQDMTPDMKNSSFEFVKQYKTSILATLEMKLLEAGLQFKKAYSDGRSKAVRAPVDKPEERSSGPNLNRPLFIEQSQEQIMQEATVNQYKEIEKSISHISQMYKEMGSIVQMHDFMVDSIQANVDEADTHVQGGKKNLLEAHQRTSKNRPFIIKVFATLYILSGVYIVLLS